MPAAVAARGGGGAHRPRAAGSAGELVRRGSLVPAEPLASILICVMDRVDALARCLASLAVLASPPEHEIIVVANGTPERALARLPDPQRLVIVPSPVNLGFAAGCNWGARFARGGHLILLNDDTEVEPGWLSGLIEVAASDPRIGAVGSRILDPDGTLQEAGSVLWSDGGTHQVGRGLPPGSTAYDRVRDVDYCSACGLLVRRDAWAAVGGFDERYFPAYYEDVDLCLALLGRGYRVVYTPAARLRHERGGSLREARRAFIGARSGRAFIAKWGATLHEYAAPPPAASEFESAVAAAVARAEARPLPPPQRREGRHLWAQPTWEEADRMRSQALRSARILERELADHLRLQRRAARRARLSGIAHRLPIPGGVITRLAGLLGGQR